MKTAIETAIFDIDEAVKCNAFSHDYMQALRVMKDKLTELLPVEKEQHSNTFLQGVMTGRRRPNKDASYAPDFDNYFTQTYNDENNPKRSDSSNNGE